MHNDREVLNCLPRCHTRNIMAFAHKVEIYIHTVMRLQIHCKSPALSPTVASLFTEKQAPDEVSLIIQRFPHAVLFFLKVDSLSLRLTAGEGHPKLSPKDLETDLVI